MGGEERTHPDAPALVDLEAYNRRMEYALIYEKDETERLAVLAASTYQTAAREAHKARRSLSAFYSLYPKRRPKNAPKA